jgi:uncharacterized protein YecT (DUF1311 family)
MSLRYIFAFALAALSTAAFAQDPPEDYDPAVIPTCLQGLPLQDRAVCIGRAAEVCIAGEAGSSNVGIGMCYSAEWRQWDDRLNAAYQTLLDQQADLAADNAAFNTNIPNAVDLLRDMQRNWIAFRDAACDWEYVQWGGGSGAGPASAACMMQLTAQQTLFLEARVN